MINLKRLKTMTIVKNRMIHSNAEQNPKLKASRKIKMIFVNKQRTTVQFRQNKFLEYVVNCVEEYIAPNVQYHTDFENSKMYGPFSVI